MISKYLRYLLPGDMITMTPPFSSDEPVDLQREVTYIYDLVSERSFAAARFCVASLKQRLGNNPSTENLEQYVEQAVNALDADTIRGELHRGRYRESIMMLAVIVDRYGKNKEEMPVEYRELRDSLLPYANGEKQTGWLRSLDTHFEK